MSDRRRRAWSYMLGFVDGWICLAARHGDPHTINLNEVEYAAALSSRLFERYGADPEKWVEHVDEVAELLLVQDFEANAT